MIDARIRRLEGAIVARLWAPLAVFEGLPAGEPAIAGATHEMALGLVARREGLAQREWKLARLRAALAGA